METSRKRTHIRFLAFVLAIILIPILLHLPIFHHELPPPHKGAPGQDRVGNRRVDASGDASSEEDVSSINVFYHETS
jgi:hypothetical protein